MLALLTVVANSVAFSVRTEFQAATNLVAMAQAEAAADAGVFRAIYELMKPESDPLRWQANGLAHEWAFGDARLEIGISDESGKIDLNAAPASLLAGLFKALEVPDAEAMALADAIVDWRDADPLRSPNGAERDDYAAAGKPYGPANAPFQSVAQLRQVLGMNEGLYRLLEPLVTVYSRRNTVNAAVAAPAVLLALPGATREQVTWYVDQRQFMLERGLPPPPFPLVQGIGTPISFYSIQVVAVLGDNARFYREGVVRLTGNPSDPFVFLAWRAPRLGINSSPQPRSRPS
jgi:general secretion pathway protein K